MARDGQMDVQLDGSKEGFVGRIEVIGGAAGRGEGTDSGGELCSCNAGC